ncbi:hypothetical protein [Secundilactobacillus kimchicus]|uniref:hypothetical protein n=1 Tax=Secundilactobacillus kimchicus TaxID=528209 RepID=UPI0024A9BBBC|nr:hypothetical protein [Secundilactobacillus kimchicus]
MAEKIWANLAGVWHNLEKEDPDCRMGSKGLSPVMWYANGAKMVSGEILPGEHSFYNYPYVMVIFKGESYRVQPNQLQIVGE